MADFFDLQKLIRSFNFCILSSDSQIPCKLQVRENVGIAQRIEKTI